MVTSPLPINNPTNKSSSAYEMIVMNACPIFGFFLLTMTIWLHMLVHLTLVLLGDAFKDCLKALCKLKMLQKA
jgi:hypothetical protein